MSSEEIINNSVDLGQRHAYTVALTVLRSQPVEVAGQSWRNWVYAKNVPIWEKFLGARRW